MAKPTKPSWAFGDPSYVIEPSAGKKTVGWLAGEKPPFQYMNWIHVQTKNWLDYLENKGERIAPTLLRSAASLTWNNGVLTFGSPIQVSFRYLTGEQINQFPAGSFTLSSGQVVVLKKDKSNPSPVSITLGTYGNLGAAQYAIVNESALTASDEENETILFRRNGSNLEIPILGQIIANNKTFQLGALSATVTAAEVTVADVGNYYTGTNVEAVLQEIGPAINTVDNFTYTGTGPIVRQLSPVIFNPQITGTPQITDFTDMNHTHLSASQGGLLDAAAISTGCTGAGTVLVRQASPTINTPTLTVPIIASFVNANHNHQNAVGGGTLDAIAIATGQFANARISQSSVTQHQAALSILESQIVDGTILARVAANENITGNWVLSGDCGVASFAVPTTDGSIRRGSFLKAFAKLTSAGPGVVLDSFNLSSGSKINTGIISCTFSNPFFNTTQDHAVVSPYFNVSAFGLMVTMGIIDNTTTQFVIKDKNDTATDGTIDAAFFGNLG